MATPARTRRTTTKRTKKAPKTEKTASKNRSPRARTSTSTPGSRVEAALRTFALAYPEAREEFPWGERVVKVRKKVFVFMGTSEGGLSLSVKLPRTGRMALLLPFAEPTGYGLGKSGWVSARFSSSETPPVGMLREWIDESYRAVAPKTLSRLALGPK